MFSSSPRLIAADHVLHRHLAPRHSPSALLSLTKTVATGARRLPVEKRLGNSASLNARVLTRNTNDSVIKELSIGPRPTGRLTPTDGIRWTFPLVPGGADRVRTDDLRLAKPALSQLSYSPRLAGIRAAEPRGPHGMTACAPESLVGLGRLELPTSRLSGVRSNRLSYRPPGSTRCQRAPCSVSQRRIAREVVGQAPNSRSPPA